MKEVRVGSICAIGLLALIAPSSLSLYRPICDSWCLGSFYRNKEVEIAIIWWDSSICVRSALLSRPFSLCVWWSPPVHLSPIADGLVSSIGHTQNVQSLNALDLSFSLCVVSWKKNKKRLRMANFFPSSLLHVTYFFRHFVLPHVVAVVVFVSFDVTTWLQSFDENHMMRVLDHRIKPRALFLLCPFGIQSVLPTWFPFVSII